MNFLSKILPAFTLILLFNLFLIPNVHANENLRPMDTRREEIEQKKANRESLIEDRKANRDENRAEICENMSGRIAERISSYEENKGAHTKKYQELITRLNEISSKLSASGLNTDTLDAAILGFDSLVQEYVTLYVDYISQLEQSEDFVCGESDGAFKDVIKQANSLRKLVIEKRREIHIFYRDEVREAIKELRKQARDLDNNNESNSEEVN